MPLNTARHISVGFDVPPGCAARFDPCEDYACIVGNLRANCDGCEVVPTCVNGYKIKNYYLFITSDPQFTISFPGSEQASWLQIDYDLILIDGNSRKALQLFLNELQKGEKAERDLARTMSDLAMSDGALHEQIVSTLYYSEDGHYVADKAFEKATLASTLYGESVRVSMDVPIPMNTRRIAIDPCEGHPCAICDVHVVYRGKELKYRPLTGYQIEDIVFFHSDDPRIESELSDNGGGDAHIDFAMRMYGAWDRGFDVLAAELEARGDQSRCFAEELEAQREESRRLAEEMQVQSRENRRLSEELEAQREENHMLMEMNGLFKMRYEEILKDGVGGIILKY